MLDLSYHIFCTCVFLGVCPLSPSPLKTPLPMIEIRCVMIFAGINFWFNNIHSLREPSLSPPKNPHKPLDYRDKEWLRALERKKKTTLEHVESTIRGTWCFTWKILKPPRVILKRDSVGWHSIETVPSLNRQWQGEKAKSPTAMS